MCRRCGCVRRNPIAGGMARPAVIEGVVEPALLLLLCEGASYGYELAPLLGRRRLVPQPVPPARVYETLRRLEAEGAVMREPEASPVGPNRWRYEITTVGRDRLDRWSAALRLAEQSLHVLLETYEITRKGGTSMGCNCNCGGAEEREEQPASQEAPAREVTERQSLETRVAQLEAQLRTLERKA